MSKFESLSDFFGQNIIEYAIEYGYSLPNILILEGNAKRLEEEYPDTYNVLLSCNALKDNRTAMSYGQDLVSSWLFEDYIYDQLKTRGMDIVLSGSDKDRVILPPKKVTASSDYMVYKGEDRRYAVELVTDYTGFWIRNRKMHIRADIYAYLLDNNGFILGVSMKDNERSFGIIEVSPHLPILKLDRHALYGGKPAVEIALPEHFFTDFYEDDIAYYLKEEIDDKALIEDAFQSFEQTIL